MMPLLFFRLRQLSYPDISVADRIAMILEKQGQFIRMRLVGRAHFMSHQRAQLHLMEGEQAGGKGPI